MATTNISLDQDAVVSEIQIAAPPERVFQALTDPKQAVEWWRNDTISIGDFELERRVGGRWGYETQQVVDGVNKFRVHGEVLEYDPPRLLSYTWMANLHYEKARRTVVRWELTPVTGGTLVKLTHSGLAEEPAARSSYSSGWPDLMDRLRRFVERQIERRSGVSSAIVENGDTCVSEIHVAAPPERVFQALTDPQQVPQWWGGTGAGQSYRCTKFERELRAGGKWRTEGINGDGRTFVVSGEYVELDAPRVLAYSWVSSWTGDVKTIVRWELEPVQGGTLVRIRHSGLAAHPEVAQSYRGWPRMLEWLQALLERGETVEDRS